ncbi:MAG: hypothetical protein ACC656_14505, partial [Candidatus Heimdallarchaeota archaeon]
FNRVKERKVTAIIGNKLGHWTVNGDRELLLGIIRDNWLENTIYYDNAKHCITKARQGEVAIISWPYTKQEILDHVKAKKLFLPKTTRHSVHYTYKECNYPLDRLAKS